ncbi:MAG: hypothetical protein HY078_12000 [Elusimicrobia bacterium]|nr:hypothetical protein [Elusimicrobiota bacterium]
MYKRTNWVAAFAIIAALSGVSQAQSFESAVEKVFAKDGSIRVQTLLLQNNIREHSTEMQAAEQEAELLEIRAGRGGRIGGGHRRPGGHHRIPGGRHRIPGGRHGNWGRWNHGGWGHHHSRGRWAWGPRGWRWWGWVAFAGVGGYAACHQYYLNLRSQCYSACDAETAGCSSACGGNPECQAQCNAENAGCNASCDYEYARFRRC